MRKRIVAARAGAVVVAAGLVAVLLLGTHPSVVSASPLRPSSARRDAVGGSASKPQQDPSSSSTTAPGSSTTVKRSGDPVTDSQDAGIGPIVIALVGVAVLLTVCCVVFWRMTRPVPLAVSRPLRPSADGGASVSRSATSGASNAAARSRRSRPSRQSRRAARRASS